MTALIVVAGPQASGKSTTAAALAGALRRRGESAALVELDAVAAMALPTLPSWEDAHAVFEAVTGLWARTALAWVVAEGSGRAEEVSRLLWQAPPRARTLTVAVTASVEVALARAQADPTRGASKEPAFLRDVYERWPGELERMRPDLVLDTERLDVAGCVTAVLGAVADLRTPTAEGPEVLQEPVPGPSDPPATGPATQHHAEGDHAHGQHEVQPVVGGVQRHEVGRAGLVDDQAVHPEHGVDQAAADEEGPRSGARA